MNETGCVQEVCIDVDVRHKCSWTIIILDTHFSIIYILDAEPTSSTFLNRAMAFRS